MTTIIVNGTFDILHTGHLNLLSYAKSLGDCLIVCVDCDERVRQLKGDSRPINTENDRKYMLEMLKPVDKVIIFRTREELIDIVSNCDIMVKGSDYVGKSVVGETYCKKVVYYDRTEHSTTKTIQSIIDR